MAGFTLGHHSAASGYEERIQERQFWRTVDTLLETFVFAYIGLQLRFVITDAVEAGYDLLQLTLAKVTGSVEMPGTGAVLPGSMINLNRIGNRFSGKAFVAEVTHALGADWKTQLSIGMAEQWLA